MSGLGGPEATSPELWVCRIPSVCPGAAASMTGAAQGLERGMLAVKSMIGLSEVASAAIIAALSVALLIVAG